MNILSEPLRYFVRESWSPIYKKTDSQSVQNLAALVYVLIYQTLLSKAIYNSIQVIHFH